MLQQCLEMFQCAGSLAGELEFLRELLETTKVYKGGGEGCALMGKGWSLMRCGLLRKVELNGRRG